MYHIICICFAGILLLIVALIKHFCLLDLEVEALRQEVGSSEITRRRDQIEMHYFNIAQTSSSLKKLAGLWLEKNLL